MKVVIDTNIWISALISKDGVCREIIRLALQEIITPQISTTLFLEYEAVMKRKSIKKLCTLTANEQEELFNAFLSTYQWNKYPTPKGQVLKTPRRGYNAFHLKGIRVVA